MTQDDRGKIFSRIVHCLKEMLIRKKMLIYTVYGAICSFFYHEALVRLKTKQTELVLSLSLALVQLLMLALIQRTEMAMIGHYASCLLLCCVWMCCGLSKILIILISLITGLNFYERLFPLFTEPSFIVLIGWFVWYLVCVFFILHAVNRSIFFRSQEKETPGLSFIFQGFLFLALSRTILGDDLLIQKTFLKQLASLNFGFLAVYAVGHAHPAYYKMPMTPAIINLTVCLFLLKTSLWAWGIVLLCLVILKNSFLDHIICPKIYSLSIKQATSYFAEAFIMLSLYMVLRSPMILEKYEQMSSLLQEFSILS